ncbi:hypothetical protein [Streptomyces sp. NBC_00102]|uniref:hypothetical protein n=1 Tax=Streptomyces sp. NBC_00102 TaxID=2975652 RepID=UPI0022501C06|nr:hypothetical protein [Streptomyces sp. NBC_00102]MCX5400061.1 hypothetical protein [Streptomyces sp. NBC_00102]
MESAPPLPGLVRYFWLLTLAGPRGEFLSGTGVVNVVPGTSRHAVYEEIRSYVLSGRQLPAGAPVVFVLERDAL